MLVVLFVAGADEEEASIATAVVSVADSDERISEENREECLSEIVVLVGCRGPAGLVFTVGAKNEEVVEASEGADELSSKVAEEPRKCVLVSALLIAKTTDEK